MRTALTLTGLLALLTATLAWGAPTALVRSGQPRARVVISATASDQVKQAAEALITHVKLASGAKLPLLADDSPDLEKPGVTIHVGPTQGFDPAGLLPKGLDDDGFVQLVRGPLVVICGPSDYGTEFGVYDFLERYVGVRWLLPGDSGTDVPRQATITVPEGKRVDAPVFMSRLFSGLRGGPQVQWARFNRMHGRVSFHHSLGENIFQPEKYRDTHPEFFPMKDGKTRYLPPDKHYHGWQPCFSCPGTVDAAVEAICAAFKANPAMTSFSLGVNDSSGHCRCPQCLAKVPAEKNFLGMDDYSDLYYDWCNRVIEGVLKQYPDKWFGCLAYSEVAAPPKHVKVHERLIPYMTYDRMKWIHPEVAKAGHEATVAWHQASPTLGWYDYIYGSPYCVPRVWFHQSQSYLKFGRDTGVKAHYAEIYPNWGEGPKPYLFLKLWWNPNQDVDKLLDEWYVRCVGPKAAPLLAKYYALWEGFWTKDILQSKWFSVGGQYLAFYSPGYLADVKPESIAESRRLLDATIAECETDAQRARAKLLEQAFQYYEASALAYQANTNLQTAQVDTEEHALAALNQSAQALAMAQLRRHLALEVFPKDPVLVQPISIENSALSGETWGGSGLWAVADWVVKGDNAVRRRVEDLAANATSPTVRDQASLLLKIAGKQATNLLKNGSFEEGTGPTSVGWGYWRKPDVPPDPPVGQMLRSQDVAHEGRYSLLCDGLLRGAPIQDLAFPGAGTYYALAWVYTPAEQTNKGTVELALTPVSDKGQNLPGMSSRVVPAAGRWMLLVVGGRIPAEMDGKPVARLRPVPIVDGFQDGGKVYVDEVGLFKVE